MSSNTSRVDPDVEKTLAFLWRSASCYSAHCPQLAAVLMRQFAVRGNKSVPPHLRSCVHCSTPLTPHTSTQYTLGRRALKMRRKKMKSRWSEITSLPHQPACVPHYVKIHCKMCRKSFVAGSSEPTTTPSSSHSTPLHMPHTTPLHKPRTTPLHTPHSTPNLKRNKRRRSSTLKSVLAEGLQQPRASTAPKLTDFLTTI